jgi:hypothetical protein
LQVNCSSSRWFHRGEVTEKVVPFEQALDAREQVRSSDVGSFVLDGAALASTPDALRDVIGDRLLAFKQIDPVFGLEIRRERGEQHLQSEHDRLVEPFPVGHVRVGSLDRGAGRLERVRGVVDDSPDGRVDGEPAQVGAVRDVEVRHGAVERVRESRFTRDAAWLLAVWTGHDVQGERRVFDRSGYRAAADVGEVVHVGVGTEHLWDTARSGKQADDSTGTRGVLRGEWVGSATDEFVVGDPP